MKNECSVVRDILPLYFEGMVSKDTAEFVEEHIKTCSECGAELEAMKAGKQIDNPETAQSAKGADGLAAIKRKIRKKTLTAIYITAFCLLAAMTLIHYFPVYRIAEVGGTSYFSGSEVAKLIYIGSAADRAEAQSVLRKADEAFNDVRHTGAQNDEKYGLLARYATDTDIYGDTAFNEHSLELWSAHLGEYEGFIWVYYSSETFNHDGSVARGSRNIPSLWNVERNEDGEWVVVQIREHP